MIGQLNTNSREVTVVGAGIAGLLAAYQLDRAGYTVTLLEAADRSGGLISTKQLPQGIAEAAAHSVQATSEVLDLCRELGIELLPVNRGSRARYIWRHGKPRRFPLSVGEALRAFIRAYVVLADSRVAPEKINLEEWARRFLGEAPFKYLLTPFVRGIYGARAAEINVGMAFPALVIPHGHSLLSFQLRKFLQRLIGKGPRKRGRPTMMSPREGMGAFTTSLERRLRERLGSRFKLNASVSELPDTPNLILCVPTAVASRLLATHDARLSAALERVAYSPLVCVTAFVEKRSFAAPPSGVGVLFPEGTSRRSLGILFNSSSFEGRVADDKETVSLTLMFGGSAHPELLSANDDEIESLVRTELKEVFDLAPGARVSVSIARWDRAVPIYNEMLEVAWNAARQGWCSVPGRILFGNYTGQVSVRGMMELAARLQTSQS